MAQSLFRSIRMKLLDEGKTFKYLKYAIGEILLIITGILIAVQISNWNEDRKAQVEFDAYVVQLREDVGLAISVVNNRVQAAESRKEEATFVLNYLDNPDARDQPFNQFDSALNGLGKFALRDIAYGYLGELINGDFTAMAKDRGLTVRTMKVVQAIKERVHLIEENSEIHRLSLATFAIYRGYSGYQDKKLEVRYDFDVLRGSNEFINASKNMIYFLGVTKNAYERIGTELEGFLAVLEEYE